MYKVFCVYIMGSLFVFIAWFCAVLSKLEEIESGIAMFYTFTGIASWMGGVGLFIIATLTFVNSDIREKFFNDKK